MATFRRVRTSWLQVLIMSGLRSPSVLRSLLSLCMLSASGLSAQVLDPPSLRCVSVSPAGDVILTWVIPPDPNAIFANYEIYHSSASGLV